MARITLDGVTKTFGDVVAVSNLRLDIRDGEFFTLLGPPGAGKTTTLRLVAGLETPDSGRVLLDGRDVTTVYPGKRDVAMIFQNFALYPHKTAFENIAYPLRERKTPEAEIRAKVQEVARVLRIDHRLNQKPGKLSGGERQRVAIGRAIVRQPSAYLMDEPLSALDALLRLEMRVELKRLQRELGQTMLYVTHDQIEAMSMSDRIGVLREGVLQQIGLPEEIYHQPANRFVATVIGNPPMNVIPVSLDGGSLRHPRFSLALTAPLVERAPLAIGVRPENVSIHPPGAEAITAEVYVVEPLGAEIVVDLRVGEDVVKALVPAPFEGRVGDVVSIAFDPAATSILRTDTDAFIVFGSAAAPLFQSVQQAAV